MVGLARGDAAVEVPTGSWAATDPSQDTSSQIGVISMAKTCFFQSNFWLGR